MIWFKVVIDCKHLYQISISYVDVSMSFPFTFFLTTKVELIQSKVSNVFYLYLQLVWVFKELVKEKIWLW